jgi:hypothetical protein
MLDATDAAAVPLREQLRRFGMRQLACPLVDAIFGVGGLTAVAVCGPSSAIAVASPAPNRWSATPAWTSPSTPPTCDGPAAISPDKGHRYCARRCSKPEEAQPSEQLHMGSSTCWHRCRTDLDLFARDLRGYSTVVVARRIGINVAGGSSAVRNSTIAWATSAGRSIGTACDAAGMTHNCPAGSASYSSAV